MSQPQTPRDIDVIRRLAPGLVLYARQWTRQAEDVVQEAFLKLFSQSTPPQNETAWLYRVVRHQAINSGRADSRRSRHEKLASDHRETWFAPVTGQTLDIQTATESLRSQPPELRETIVARIWGGLSFDEIASLTGTSPSTAARRFRAGLEALRDQLGVTQEDRHE